MFINKNVFSLIIEEHEDVSHALRKIERNKQKIVYVVNSDGVLLGSLTDGDFRRYLLQVDKFDLNAPVTVVMRENCLSMPYESSPDEIEAAFDSGVMSIPLVDSYDRVIAVAVPGPKFFQVGTARISNEDPAFVIAEIGNNHQGSLETAKTMIRLAAQSGVDCVKFQMRDMDALYGGSKAESHDLGSQYTLDLLSKYQLPLQDMFAAFDYCKEVGVIPLCTPWDLVSLRHLESYGFDAYKIASADLTNFELLSAVADTGKLLICSTGMSSEKEILETIDFLERRKAQFVFLHCNSTYPTPYKDINLNYITRLKKISRTLVGYSGHERGWSVPLAAISLGAKIIEKHFTLDKEQEGNDHKVSLLPSELTEMVDSIRAVEVALGTGGLRELSQGELINREVLAKSLFARRDISSGEIIQSDDIVIRAPGNGLQPNRQTHLIGIKAPRDIISGEPFFETDITGVTRRKERYSFDRPYGIPVRYHDYKTLTNSVEMDFVEFHLSYGDMRLDLSDYLDLQPCLGFAVHAPELFENDHLLDLASFDYEYRSQSISHLQRVINHTRELSKFFPATKCPVIVVNAGGWNAESFWSDSEVTKKYELVRQSIAELDRSGVSLSIQTMPPFPWHFGGQSHHSLFVSPDQIVDFCKHIDVGICLDLSHSMMACNYYDWSFEEFVSTVAPYANHLHIVDAKGVDGEGIQIGQGDVDFNKIGKLLDEFAEGIQFIPEIWQGHKYNGEGFWNALAFLETKLR